MNFPIHVYNVDTDSIEKGNGMEITPVLDSTAYTLEFNLADNLSSLQTPVSQVVGGKSSSSFTSTKMKHLFSNKKQENSASIRHGYYGGFNFFDDQDKYDAVFGKRPTIYNFHPLSNTGTNAQQLLLLHAGKCKLDFFLSVAERDYVGTNVLRPSLSVIAVYKELGQLSQEYYGDDELLRAYNPEELFDQFNALTSNLPDNAQLWSVTLCSLYHNALNKNLFNKITENETFTISDLTSLTTKISNLKHYNICVHKQ